MNQANKVNKFYIALLLCTIGALLSACDGFFDKDNTPPPAKLVALTPSVNINTLWTTHSGFGEGDDYLKLGTAVTEKTVFTASKNGTVTATDKISGKNNWHAYTRFTISAGPTAYADLVLVGTRDGEVIALHQQNGAVAWKTAVSSEVLAAPAGIHGAVLAKTIDGKLFALSAQNGAILWSYQQNEPTLILRGASAPQPTLNNQIVTGFANGSLTKLTLKEGSLLWRITVARPQGSFAIQRMVDIDSDPIVDGQHIYAATYQGNISSLSLSTGKVYWSHPISSYSGIAADPKTVYVSDGDGYVWAFAADSGAVIWRQPQLAARNLTGPVSMGQYIVVGDGQGYLHWLSKQDGHFVARIKTGSSGILATPVVNNSILYAISKDGYLAAYSLT